MNRIGQAMALRAWRAASRVSACAGAKRLSLAIAELERLHPITALPYITFLPSDHPETSDATPPLSTIIEGDYRYRLLVESVRDYAIFILDTEGYVRTWNPGAERIKQYAADEIIGKHFSVFYPPDVDARSLCDLELEVATRDGRFEAEGWRVRQDGSRFWANVVITALRNPEGVLVGFAKVTRDLTERREAEEQARRARLLVESVKDYAIFVLDTEGHVCTWNAGAERIKQYKAEEIMGRHFSVFYPREVDGKAVCDFELEVATREGRFEAEGWRVRRDGSRFWANVIITALRNPDGILVGFAKVTRDLTERRNAEEKMRLLAAENAALEEKARIQQFQENFLAILGHDLRNPLAAIDMGLGILRQRSSDDASLRILDRIGSSSRRMSRMIQQILDLTRSRLAGGIEINPQPTDLCRVLSSIVDELRTAYPRAIIELECSPLTAISDSDRLEQVFSNLIGNAIVHGGDEGIVRIAGGTQDGKACVTVHNDGPPIPDHLRGTLFDPFRRGDTESRTSKTAGLGLGLYISRELVIAHGGSIEFESSAHHGTTFRVTLPKEFFKP